MKILTLTDLPRRADNFKSRIVTIGFSLISCDIYPAKHATLRGDKTETINKEVPEQRFSFHQLLGFLVAFFYAEKHQYTPKDHHFILSLLKPGFDSYPADFTIKSFCT